MTWSPSIRRLPESLPVHLERLTGQLGDLATELRTSVAGLAGDAIGRAVRDALLRFWGKTSRSNPRPAREEDDSSGWSNDEWDFRPPSWDEPVEAPVDRTSETPRLAHVLQACGWLLQHASLLGLCGVGATVGGILLFRGSLGIPGIDLVNAVAEIATLIALLSNGSKQLLLN